MSVKYTVRQQIKTKQHKARQDETKHKTGQDKTKHKTRQDKTKQNKTKQNELILKYIYTLKTKQAEKQSLIKTQLV